MPKESKIRVMTLKVGEEPQVVTMPNTLEAKQQFVDGYIDIVSFEVDGESYDLTVNDEGLLIGLQPNLLFPSGMAIVGDCFVSRVNVDEGEQTSLRDEDIEPLNAFLNRHRCGAIR